MHLFFVLDYEAITLASKSGSNIQIKESILGRHKSANSFISTNSIGHLHLSQSSLSSTSTPSISSFPSISPTDHDEVIHIKNGQLANNVNSFNSLDNSRKICNNLFDVPTSENSVNGEENEYLSNSVEASNFEYCENRAAIHDSMNTNSHDTSGISNSNHNENKIVCLDQNGSDYDAKANPLAPSMYKSNHATNAVNNVSSHNPSNPNSMLKTQKTFKPGNNLRSIMLDDKNDRKAVKEIGRFSPTPTPYVDFPLQFNFGSTYASSVTVFFDES